MLMNPDLTLPQKSACFHASLAGTIDIQARKMREIHGINTVGLSGGVFQNRRLVEQARAKLEQSGFQVLLHRTIPANDAGISFGQIVEAGCRAV